MLLPLLALVGIVAARHMGAHLPGKAVFYAVVVLFTMVWARGVQEMFRMPRFLSVAVAAAGSYSFLTLDWRPAFAAVCVAVPVGAFLAAGKPLDRERS